MSTSKKINVSPAFHKRLDQEAKQHLQNDPQKLRQYTRQVMENYASNFTLQDKSNRTNSSYGKRLYSSDLVWFATIHQERKEKEGAEKGTSKTGLHQHVHILISAQDKNRQYRLNPRGRKSHFVFKRWQVENGKTFQQMFGYQKATTSEKLTIGMPEATKLRHQERIRYRVAHLNQYFVGSQKLDAERALSIGKAQEYGKGFFFNLHRLTKQYQEGKLVNNPYHMLELAQMNDMFGKEKTEVIVANLSNQFYGKVSSVQTAKAVSEMIGKEEQMITNHSRGSSRGSKGQRNLSYNTSTSPQERHLVKPQQVMQLQPGQFIGQTVESSLPYFWAQTKLTKAQQHYALDSFKVFEQNSQQAIISANFQSIRKEVADIVKRYPNIYQTRP